MIIFIFWAIMVSVKQWIVKITIKNNNNILKTEVSIIIQYIIVIFKTCIKYKNYINRSGGRFPSLIRILDLI